MVARPGSADRPRALGGRSVPWTVTISLAGVLAGAMLAVTGCAKVPGVYVAEQKGDGTSTASGTFSAPAYADKNWSKVVSTVTEKAVEASTLLPAVAADPAAAGKQYGIQAGIGSPYSFMVKGAGTVIAVDQSQGPGRMQVDLDPADGTPDLNIAIGPVFLGTAVRDAVRFINFGEFPNQIEYANVATELNTQARTKVVAPIDMKTVQGKKITFAGAFQSLDPKNIVVTPVQLAVTQ